MDWCRWRGILIQFFFVEILTDFEWRDKLWQGNKQEKEVEEELELVVEHKRNESDHVVLLILDFVAEADLGSHSPVHLNRPFLQLITNWAYFLWHHQAKALPHLVACGQLLLMKVNSVKAYLILLKLTLNARYTYSIDQRLLGLVTAVLVQVRVWIVLLETSWVLLLTPLETNGNMVFFDLLVGRVCELLIVVVVVHGLKFELALN